jgi:hypothetical protein
MTTTEFKNKLREVDYLNGTTEDSLLVDDHLTKIFIDMSAYNFLIKICKEYNCSADYLLGLTDDYYGGR